MSSTAETPLMPLEPKQKQQYQEAEPDNPRKSALSEASRDSGVSLSSPRVDVACSTTSPAASAATPAKPLQTQHTQPSPRIRPPRSFNDFFEMTREVLGRGAFAEVRACVHRTTGEQLAVKVIEKRRALTAGLESSPARDSNAEAAAIRRLRRRVHKEVELFKTCKNQPHVLQLRDFFEDSHRFYMVFERMRGGTLLDALRDRPGGRLSEPEAASVARQLANALAFLHARGVAHRDLKPDNVLLAQRNQLFPVKICDLDLGSELPPEVRGLSGQSGAGANIGSALLSSLSPGSSSGETLEGPTPQLLTPVGSLEYMAPEVVDAWLGDQRSYDKKCDLWSLGVIVYWLLVGHPPFVPNCGADCGWRRGEDCHRCQLELCTKIQNGHVSFPASDWRGLSRGARDLVHALLQRSPAERLSAACVLEHDWIRNAGALPAEHPLAGLCGDDEHSLSGSSSCSNTDDDDDEDDFDAPYRLASEQIKRERAQSDASGVAFVNERTPQSPLRSVPEFKFGYEQDMFKLSDVQPPQQSTPNENKPPPRQQQQQQIKASHYKSPERTVQAVRALDSNANCIPTSGGSGSGSNSTSSPRAPGDNRKRANEQSSGKGVPAGSKAVGVENGAGDSPLLLKAPNGVVPPSPTGVAAAPKRQADHQRREVSWVDVIDGQAEFDDDPLFN